jgi:hypothetical protein
MGMKHRAFMGWDCMEVSIGINNVTKNLLEPIMFGVEIKGCIDGQNFEPEDSTKKALDHSRALALKRRDSRKKIAQLVTRVHWQLHRQRIPHFGHPHSSIRAAQR